MTDIKTLLVATDFSETSKKAFPAARTLAERFGARVLLVYAEDDRFVPLVEYAAIDLENLRRQQRERAFERLTALAAEAFRDLNVEPLVLEGAPHEALVRLAEERAVELIVMATHGRGFFSQAILGSTTDRVLRRAACPVLVVRDVNAH